MKRRGFLGTLAGVVAGLFGRKVAAACDGDAEGEMRHLCYRRGPDGDYHECDPEEPREGDRIVMMGLAGKRLYLCTALTVGKGGTKTLPDGVVGTWAANGTVVDLLRPEKLSPIEDTKPSLCGTYCYRLEADHQFHPVGRDQAGPGDKLVVLQFRDGLLLYCERFDVGPKGRFPGPNGDPLIDVVPESRVEVAPDFSSAWEDAGLRPPRAAAARSLSETNRVSPKDRATWERIDKEWRENPEKYANYAWEDTR